ncbi:MAG: hypothetical protein AAF629_36460, partial [Chloroflexota bacterium]
LQKKQALLLGEELEEGLFRKLIDNYKVLYSIDHETQAITILRIKTTSDHYKMLLDLIESRVSDLEHT